MPKVQGTLKTGLLMEKGKGRRRWVYVLTAGDQLVAKADRSRKQWLTACSGGDSAWTTVVGQSRVVAAKAVMAVGAIARLSHVSVIRRLQEEDK